MATAARQPVQSTTPQAPTRPRTLVFVALAIALPLLAGLAWHFASDNPLWPVLRTSLSHCEVREAQLSPTSPEGDYRAHIVYATFLGRFTETLVFITAADAPWSLTSLNPDHAVAEIAGDRSLDAVDWQLTADGVPALQLWFVPKAFPSQVHRLERSQGRVIIKTLTSTPAPGAERLDY